MKKGIAVVLACLCALAPMCGLCQTYAVFDTIRLALPEDSTLVGTEIYDAQMRLAMYVESVFFEQSVFMEEYGYASQEECVRGVIDALGNVTILDGGNYAPGVNGYPLYVYHCTAQKFMPPDGTAQDCADPLTIALVIDEANEMAYMVFFYREMAVDQTVLDVLTTVSAYQNDYAQRAQDGLYAWEGGAEFYRD